MRPPPPAFHTLAEEMSLNRDATHITHGHVLSRLSYTPLSKLPSCAPAQPLCRSHLGATSEILLRVICLRENGFPCHFYFPLNLLSAKYRKLKIRCGAKKLSFGAKKCAKHV